MMLEQVFEYQCMDLGMDFMESMLICYAIPRFYELDPTEIRFNNFIACLNISVSKSETFDICPILWMGEILNKY